MVGLGGKEIAAFNYEAPFDTHRLTFLVETIGNLVRFGGQGFGKVARGALVKRSHNAAFVKRAELGVFAFGTRC